MISEVTNFKFTDKIKVRLLLNVWIVLLLLICNQVLAQKKTNVLFIVIDDLRPALGCYGDQNASSPNIDQLAAMGTLFTDAYCQQAVCAPSRASFMTGKKPDHTKVWNLNTHFRKALPNVVTLPQYFKNNGYYTRQIGKIYHDPKLAQDPISWSVPELLAVTTNHGKYALDSNLAKAPKSTATESADVADNAYIDGMVADAAVKELRNMGNKPFFLAIGFRRPHLPFSAPSSYWKKNENTVFPLSPDTAKGTGIPRFSMHNSIELRGYTDIPKIGVIDAKKATELIRGYYTAVAFMDEQVGKVLNELKKLKLDENTVVVLLSDHGFHLGEHGLWGKTTNSKLDTRVPLIISDPSKLAAGKKSDAVVQLVDLYATIAELCQLPSPNTDGKSFAKILKGQQYIGSGLAFSQFPNQMSYQDRPEVMGYVVHSKHFGYTEWIQLKTGKVLARELYDYTTDPNENNNVAENIRYKKQITFLSQQLRAYRDL